MKIYLSSKEFQPKARVSAESENVGPQRAEIHHGFGLFAAR
jgi:hypothetical protein